MTREEALDVTIKAFSWRLMADATNGDMIKAMFPNFEEDVTIVGDTILLERYMPYCKMQFHKDWWNAPYKIESEE